MLLPIEVKQENCTLEVAIELCVKIYNLLEPKGFYPALTGGLLYKQGNRKDIDIVLYRNRQKVECFETIDLVDELSSLGLNVVNSFGFVTKAEYKGFVVDIFNPETDNEAFNKWYESQKEELLMK